MKTFVFDNFKFNLNWPKINQEKIARFASIKSVAYTFAAGGCYIPTWNPAWAAIFATLCNSKTRQPIAQENCWNPQNCGKSSSLHLNKIESFGFPVLWVTSY